MPAAKQNTNAYCFIDASNLFYGGFKAMGWKVDYKKLKDYLATKYGVKKLFYYGGIETYGFEFDTASIGDCPINDIVNYLEDWLEKGRDTLSEAEIILLGRHIARAKFYRMLASFGYILKLKPVKYIRDEEGRMTKKANCDVDLTFDAMRLANEYGKFVLLSGDGDFEILLKYFDESGKEVVILSNPDHTAKNLKKRFQKQYKNFEEIRPSIEYIEVDVTKSE